MKKEWLVKTLALGIIVLFITTGFVSAFYINESKVTMDNHPPGLPIVTGPTFVRPGMHEWTFKAIDPDGDNVSYQIDWGDGYWDSWFGWYASGEEILMGHDYQGYGKIGLMARAKDTHNATGEWTGIHVVILKSKQIINLPFLQFLEQFPNSFPLLKYVMGWR